MTDGREDYSRYFYLWHLIATGVLKPQPAVGGSSGDSDCPVIEETVWDEASFVDRPVKIALIDMGVAKFHPNLEPKAGGTDPQTSRIIWEDALDLAAHRYGVKYQPMTQRHREERAQFLSNIDPALITTATVREIAILNRLRDSYGVERYVDVYKQSYATHGTACAGLVCGTSFSDDQFGNAGNLINYYGVDPYSQIVPITTSISPDPEQLIAAFLYAHSLNVDVILFPRDAADPLKMPKYNRLDTNEKTRLHSPGPQDRAWRLFEKVIKTVSMDIPVVCAAGNDGRSELIYPANLAIDEVADRNGIIAVGAVSYRGYRSGYSNYGAGLTVVAPSDDGEVYNRHQIRLDRQAASANDFWIEDVHEHPDIPEIEFSAERLVTLDVPGPRGYAAGSREVSPIDRIESVDDPGGLYTDIGGTSGSSAIVAGVVALMQRQHTTRRTGPEIKNSLLALGTATAPNLDISEWYWVNRNPAELALDAINGPVVNPPDPDGPTFEELFGSGGLVDVRTLLGL